MPSISTGTISSPRIATMPCSGRTQRSDRRSPQRIDLGQGKSATIARIASASTSRGRAARLARSPRNRRRRVPRAGRCVSPVLRRKPSSACGGARGARALDLLADCFGRVGDVARDQRQPARRRISRRSRPSSSPAALSAFGEQPREIVARLRLHPRRDFLATAVRAGNRPSGGVPFASIHARARAPSRGRGRGRYRPGARRPRSRRAPAAC